MEYSGIGCIHSDGAGTDDAGTDDVGTDDVGTDDAGTDDVVGCTVVLDAGH